MRIFYCFILLIAMPVMATEIPGTALLNYFGKTCKSNDQWVQGALADSRGLIDTLNALASDPDCASTMGALSQLNSLNYQLAVLDKLGETKNTIETYNAEEQQLLIQLTLTTDSEVIKEINSNLRTIQVKRARVLNQERSAEQLSGSDKVKVLGQIAMSANSSFQQISANQKCLAKNPSLLQNATSIVSLVGAAVTVINPAIGITMSAGATFARVGMDGIQSSRNSRRVRRLADNTTNFEAYLCALESMGERFCAMEDARVFIDFKKGNDHRRIDGSELSQAIRINDREIPTLLDWLNKVRNGVDPSTTADADRRNEVRTRELIVKKRADFGKALIEQNRNIYKSLEGKPEEQWVFLRSVILSMAPTNESYSSGPQVKDPLNDIYSRGYSPYYLCGLSATDPDIIDAFGGYKDFKNYNKPANLEVTLDSVKEKFTQWIDRATIQVNSELSEVHQPDPLATINSANETSDPWKVTPLDALKTTADFLENNYPSESQRDFKEIYKDTVEKLRKIHEIAAVAIATGDMSAEGDPKKTPIEKIFEIAQLKYGVVVIQARLEMIVRLSLLEYIKNSSEEDQILVAQILATDRFFNTISNMNGTSNYAQIEDSIKSARAYTIKNISSFMQIFGKNINRSLRKLYEEEKTSNDTNESANRHLRKKMCFLLLGANNVSKWIDPELCQGLKLEASMSGGPETITIDQSTFSLDLKERACIRREYFRQSEIYQKWKISPR